MFRRRRPLAASEVNDEEKCQSSISLTTLFQINNVLRLKYFRQLNSIEILLFQQRKEVRSYQLFFPWIFL